MITRYHIFTDINGKPWDEWTGDLEEAKGIYVDMLKRSRDNDYSGPRARLYAEEYADEEALENDDMDNEECLRSYGPYPQ